MLDMRRDVFPCGSSTLKTDITVESKDQAFDILSLEGVSNRLWAGSRNVNRQGTSLFRYLYGSGLAPDALSAPAIVFYALPDRSW